MASSHTAPIAKERTASANTRPMVDVSEVNAGRAMTLCSGNGKAGVEPLSAKESTQGIDM